MKTVTSVTIAGLVLTISLFASGCNLQEACRDGDRDIARPLNNALAILNAAPAGKLIDKASCTSITKSMRNFNEYSTALASYAAHTFGTATCAQYETNETKGYSCWCIDHRDDESNCTMTCGDTYSTNEQCVKWDGSKIKNLPANNRIMTLSNDLILIGVNCDALDLDTQSSFKSDLAEVLQEYQAVHDNDCK